MVNQRLGLSVGRIVAKGYRGNDGAVVPGGTTEPFAPADNGDAVGTGAEAAQWREAGGMWNGGTLQGLTSKLGYLKRLGVTAVWVSPVFKQVAFHPTYHGYGIQNFLDVDAHFGTREDLKEMVRVAHQNGIHVVLDIILNHSGDVFGYNPNRYPTPSPDGGTFLDPRWDGNAYDVEGFRDSTGAASLPFGGLTPADRAAAWPDGAIWPSSLRRIGSWGTGSQEVALLLAGPRRRPRRRRCHGLGPSAKRKAQ